MWETGMIEFDLEKEKIRVSDERLFKAMGYTTGAVPDPAAAALKSARKKADELCRFRAGYQIIPEEAFRLGPRDFTCWDIHFYCGPAIATFLQGCIGLTLFTATIGLGYEQWVREILGTDPVTGFVADALASELTESVADAVEGEIAEWAKAKMFHVTNRFSPGYCGWEVSEQKKLFSLLPSGFCGITLSESSLMTPLKSVSGVIGWGVNAEREDYACETCDRTDCQKRKKKESVKSDG